MPSHWPPLHGGASEGGEGRRGVSKGRRQRGARQACKAGHTHAHWETGALPQPTQWAPRRNSHRSYHHTPSGQSLVEVQVTFLPSRVVA